MKQATYVITCDNCNQKIEVDDMIRNYSDKFLLISIDTMHFDVCKDCCKTFKFIPGVLL